METISMAEVVYYVHVDDAGEPAVWGGAGENNITAYGGSWRAWRDPGAKGRQIRALALEDLQGLLRGRWSHVEHVVYFPRDAGRQFSREEIFEMEVP